MWSLILDIVCRSNAKHNAYEAPYGSLRDYTAFQGQICTRRKDRLSDLAPPNIIRRGSSNIKGDSVGLKIAVLAVTGAIGSPALVSGQSTSRLDRYTIFAFD